MEDLNGSMMATAKQSINSDMIGIRYRVYQNIVDLELSDTVLVCALCTFPLFVFSFWHLSILGNNCISQIATDLDRSYEKT